MVLFLSLSANTVFAEQPLLKKYIIEYNMQAVEKSLKEDTYRGEEGILAVNPEEAKSLGMKTVINEDYLESMRLFREADECLEKAKKAMSTSVKEKSAGYYAAEIFENSLKYKKKSVEAKNRLMSYHLRLNPDDDDRLNEGACSKIIDRILEECLNNRTTGLRDKLALFYNTCHGIAVKNYHLTDNNTRFVNYVFNGFLKESSQEEKKNYDLDQCYSPRGSYNWKDAAGFGTSEYVLLIDEAFKKLGDTIYTVDPLLFMALVKKESSFRPLAVSSVGAAGLTQIMPETARELGMNNIFMPDYYQEAVSLMKRERDGRNSALSIINEITEENGLKLAEQARNLMQESLELGRRRAELYEKYEAELVKNSNDDRLQAALSIEYGLKYFAGLMKKYNGDISLALASYNAGEYRVRDFNGIPPYKETVAFRNKILQFYREYLDDALDK
jgi:soluble lytic murein transglycosylase-like protein